VTVDELEARIAAAEGKYETFRLAALEWGDDIDTHSRLIDKLWQPGRGAGGVATEDPLWS
jgi:hypothetical protein